MKTSPSAWRETFTNPAFYASAGFLIVGAAMDNFDSQQIPRLFPDRTAPYDTLFHLLPYVSWTQYLTDSANIFSAILLAIFLFPKRYRQLPKVLAVLGLGYLIRSVLILADPFAGPLGNYVHYGLTSIHQYGEFPSGHVLLVTAVYFLIDGKETPILKWLALLSVIVEVVALLLSHGHYTIDIVGGFLVAFFAYHSLKDWCWLSIS